MIQAYKADGNAVGFVSVGNATAVAIAQCQESDAASVILVLEQELQDAAPTPALERAVEFDCRPCPGAAMAVKLRST